MSEYGPNEVPSIRIECEEGDLILHWFNTKIRTFKDEQFNHVELREASGDLKGLRVTQSFMDFLFEHEFPYQFDPVVDDNTMEWFVRSETKMLDDELGEL